MLYWRYKLSNKEYCLETPNLCRIFYVYRYVGNEIHSFLDILFKDEMKKSHESELETLRKELENEITSQKNIAEVSSYLVASLWLFWL